MTMMNAKRIAHKNAADMKWDKNAVKVLTNGEETISKLRAYSLGGRECVEIRIRSDWTGRGARAVLRKEDALALAIELMKVAEE